MSGGQDWAAEMIRDDALAAVDRQEQVRMLADDCREMVAALGQDVWRSPAARLLKRRCEQVRVACDLVLQSVESPESRVESQSKWQPLSPTLAGR